MTTLPNFIIDTIVNAIGLAMFAATVLILSAIAIG